MAAVPTVRPGELFSLTLPATRSSLPMATSIIEPLTTHLKFSERDAFRVAVSVEESCVNVIDHAYPAGEPGDFTLRARIERLSLVLSVEDRGLPRDPFARPGFSEENPTAPGLGTRLLEGLADEVRYLALGRGGKAVELLFRLPVMPMDEGENDGTDAQVVRIPPDQLTVREFRPEDAGEVAQCAYRCYDYSYMGEALYVPERVIEMNRSGEMVSVVAEGPDGHVYGHAALLFTQGAPAPESGCAFVVPEARGGGTFVRLKRRLLELAVERGAPGVWSEAVTNHPASQRANLELGVKETGLLFGMVPTSMRMRNLPGLPRRGSLLLFYTSFEERPFSRVCLPPWHAEVLRQIYERMAFTIEEVEPEPPAPDSLSEVIISLRLDVNIATMRVVSIGEDLGELMKREITRACDAGARVVLLDLPMRDPAIPAAVLALEAIGCHFAGLIPRRYVDGDSLRMTYLDHVQIEVGALALASEFGQQLRDYLVRGIKPELRVSGE